MEWIARTFPPEISLTSSQVDRWMGGAFVSPTRIETPDAKHLRACYPLHVHVLLNADTGICTSLSFSVIPRSLWAKAARSVMLQPQPSASSKLSNGVFTDNAVEKLSSMVTCSDPQALCCFYFWLTVSVRSLVLIPCSCFRSLYPMLSCAPLSPI